MESHTHRQTGWWSGNGIEVAYIDDDLHRLSERQRLVLYTEGAQRLSKSAWAEFVKHARQSQCDYIDFFTTEPELDAVWRSLGALNVFERPVIVKGLPDSVNQFTFHAWDRENWTHRAMGSLQ